MIDKARQLKQFIQEFNIQDKYGLKNAVNYHVKDEHLQYLLKTCIKNDVLAAFLKANADQQAISKEFCSDQAQKLLVGTEGLTNADSKTAIRYCLYLSDVIKDEDIARKAAEKKRLEAPKPKPIVEMRKPSRPKLALEQGIEQRKPKPVIVPMPPKERVQARPNSNLLPIDDIKAEIEVRPMPRKDKRLSRKERARQERLEKRKQTIPVYPKKNKSSIWGTFRWFFLLIFLILLGFGLYKAWDFYQDFTAPKKYCLATSLSIREYPRDDATKIGKVDFGEELVFYENVPLMDGWAEVKGNGIRGFVSTEYLASKKYYWELNSILGDEKAYFDTGKTRNRRALRTYFEQQKYCGKMPNRIKLQLYAGKDKRECYSYWQIFTKDRSSVLTQLDLTGNSKEDFVFILDNAKSEGKKLVVCKYGEDLSPSFHEMILPDEVREIFPVNRTDRTKEWYVGNRKNNRSKIKERIKRDAFYFKRTDVEGKEEMVLIYYKDGRVHEYIQ